MSDKEKIVELIRRLRAGIVLKASPAGGIRGTQIDFDIQATKQLMREAADYIEAHFVEGAKP